MNDGVDADVATMNTTTDVEFLASTVATPRKARVFVQEDPALVI